MTLRTGAVSIMVAALSQDLYHLVDLFSGKIADCDPPVSPSSPVAPRLWQNISSGYSSFPASLRCSLISSDLGDFALAEWSSGPYTPGFVWIIGV